MSKRRRRHTIDRTILEFQRDPWSALNANTGILEALVNGWGNSSRSASAKYLASTIEEFSKTEGPVLECGSGLTTIILGVLAQQADREIWTLEHNEEWGINVSRYLQKLGISSVHLSVDPLKNYGDYTWYEPPLSEIPSNFGLVICHGPPGDCRGGRIEKLPVMREYLSSSCTILLDDLVGDQEVEFANDWSTSLNGSVEFTGTEKSFAAIRVGRNNLGGGVKINENQPLVTIGMPAYNSEEFVCQSTESILKQSYTNLSLIILDNASQDGTQELCMKYVRQDPRVHYYRRFENVGVFRNYNDVFLKCRSKYFKWQSSSDWLGSEMLYSCVQIMESDASVVLVCPSVTLVDVHGHSDSYAGDFGLKMSNPSERFIYLLDNIRLCNIFNGVIRTAALQKTGLNKIYRGSDVVLLAELALLGKLVLLPERRWFRRMTPSTASKLQSAEQSDNFFAGEPAGFGDYESWKKMWALTLVVFRSPVEIKTKIACMKYVLRKWIWTRADLWRELWNR